MGTDNWIILSISNNVAISVSHPLVFINLARYPILGHSSSIASRLDGKLRRNIPSPKLSVLLTIAFFPSFASVLPSIPSNRSVVKDDLARGGGVGGAWLFTPPCQLRLGHLEAHAAFLFFVSDSSSISKFEEFLFYS